MIDIDNDGIILVDSVEKFLRLYGQKVESTEMYSYYSCTEELSWIKREDDDQKTKD